MKSRFKALIKPIFVSVASQLGPQTFTRGKAKLWVLMYHRVLPKTDIRFQEEEPGMLVEPETFAMHVKEMKKNFDLLSLNDWVKANIKGESLPQKACAITFDDGWLDNFEYAFPILQAESAPATLFAVAGKIGTDFQFWPNIVSSLLLNGAAHKMLAHPLFQSLSKLTNTIMAKPSRDDIAFIISQLKQHSDEAIFSALADISWRQLCPSSRSPALMNWEQLKVMQESGLVDIGSHTCSHRRLTNALPKTELETEIISSKKILQEKLNAPIELFCFPNGDYNEEALALVKANYTAAVTTQKGINQYGATRLHELTRIGLHDEISHTRKLFRAKLSGWL